MSDRKTRKPREGTVAQALEAAILRLGAARIRLYYDRSLYAHPVAKAVLGDVTECTDLVLDVYEALKAAHQSSLTAPVVSLPPTLLLPSATNLAPQPLPPRVQKPKKVDPNVVKRPRGRPRKVAPAAEESL